MKGDTMKEILLDIFKGALIGVANVIPGVSGGTLAVSTGVYEKIINAINNIRKDFKQSVKTLWPFALGIVLGIALLAFVITFLLEKFAVPTTACFIGLVLGGVPTLYKKIKDEKIKWTHVVSFIFTLAIIIVPVVIAVNTKAISSVEINFLNIIILMALGVISAAAMVVPGVSGSMILMMLGYYNFIIGTIKDTISSFIHLNMTAFGSGVVIMIPFAIGVLLGIVIISKIISYVLKKWPNASTWGILGLVVASPFAIIVKLGAIVLTPEVIIASILTFIAGYFISSKLGEN